MFPDLSGSDQWTTSILKLYLKLSSAIANGRTLRSSDSDQLNVPRVRTAEGSRAFSVASPRLWNELPLEIRSAITQISFRTKLKAYFLVRLFLGGPAGQDAKRRRFWNYESDYDYVCRASVLRSPRI